jgi:cytochrome c-type biogenesis protein CcmH
MIPYAATARKALDACAALSYNPANFEETLVKNTKLFVPILFIAIVLLAGAAAWKGLLHGGKESSGSIAGIVAIDPSLASRVEPGDVLFVIVRRPGGSPRPLAAVRIEHPQFPVPFEITNADVMIQGAELRGMVAVVARLDKDGNAGPAQPGDIEGEFAKNPTMAGARDVEILLNKVK